MRLIARCLQSLFLILWLLPAPARAALPDPVAFGLAVELGDTSRVKAWLDEGLDPDYQASRVGTGLMIAAWNGDIEMMKLFVERGANLQRANRNGEQALPLAAWGGHMDAVKWLLDHGAPLNATGPGWSALHYAVFNGQDKLARFLVERGAQIDARSPNGSTPLMMAAREGRDELARLLIERGADPRAKSDWGDTALTMAMRYDHYALGKLISTAEEFAVAVKAPRENFGEASRSLAAPSEIEEILRKIRAAEAAGKPTDELRKQLLAAVEAFKRSATPSAQNARRPLPRPYQPKSIVITAKRGKPGAERAEVVVDGKPGAAPAKQAGSASLARGPVSPAQIADLVRQIRLAEAQGRPVDEFKQQLYDAVEGLKK